MNRKRPRSPSRSTSHSLASEDEPPRALDTALLRERHSLANEDEPLLRLFELRGGVAWNEWG